MSDNRPLNGKFAVLVLLFCFLNFSFPSGVKAQYDSTDYLINLIDSAKDYWLGQQQPSGNFYDEVDKKLSPDDHYGHTHLGAVFIWMGVREGNSDLVDRGVKAIEYYLATPNKGHQPFNQLAISWAYSLIANNNKYKFNKNTWESYLKNSSVMSKQEGCKKYTNNWNLVEAVAGKQITMTGLNYDKVWDRCDSFMVDVVPGTLTKDGLGGDPGTWPLSYHAFSTALVARYLRLVAQKGDGDYSRIKDYFLRMVDTQLNLMAPDGDFAFFGRSSEQSFVLMSMAYSFEIASTLGTDKAGQYKKAAYLVIERFKRYHGLNERGFVNIVPKMRYKGELNRDGLDSYAHLSVYNGLTLLLAAWTYEVSVNTKGISFRDIPSESNFFYLEESGPGFAVLRYGNLWFLVSGSSYNYYNRDVRYDFGLIRAKKKVGTVWLDILPVRPLILADKDDPNRSYKYSLAPRGFYNGGPFVLVGNKLKIVSPGAVEVVANLVDRNTFRDTGMTVSVVYITDGDTIEMRVSRFPDMVRNYYVSFLFREKPIRKRDGYGNVVLTDGKVAISLSENLVLDYLTNSDIQSFSNSESGTIFWDRFELPNPNKDVIVRVSFEAPLSDLNSDGKVDIFDYNILISNFGKTGSPGWIPADINKDGKVDIFDYSVLVEGFGRDIVY